MRIRVICTKHIDSINLITKALQEYGHIDEAIFYSNNIMIEAHYPVQPLYNLLERDKITHIELKPNYPHDNFKGAIIISK